VTLPYGARQLSKRDLAQLEPMFAMYLDIQKGLVLEELDQAEVQGRWKSYVKRWYVRSCRVLRMIAVLQVGPFH
jgi:hypothetical protein